MENITNYYIDKEGKKISEETQNDGWTLTRFNYDEERENEQEVLKARDFLQELGSEADPSDLIKYVHEEELYHNSDFNSPIHCTNLGRLSDPDYLQKQLQASLEKVLDNSSFALISISNQTKYKGHRCLYGTGIIHTRKCSIPVKWEMLYDQYFKGMILI